MNYLPYSTAAGNFLSPLVFGGPRQLERNKGDNINRLRSENIEG